MAADKSRSQYTPTTRGGAPSARRLMYADVWKRLAGGAGAVSAVVAGRAGAAAAAAVSAAAIVAARGRATRSAGGAAAAAAAAAMAGDGDGPLPLPAPTVEPSAAPRGGSSSSSASSVGNVGYPCACAASIACCSCFSCAAVTTPPCSSPIKASSKTRCRCTSVTVAARRTAACASPSSLRSVFAKGRWGRQLSIATTATTCGTRRELKGTCPRARTGPASPSGPRRRAPAAAAPSAVTARARGNSCA